MKKKKYIKKFEQFNQTEIVIPSIIKDKKRKIFIIPDWMVY